MIKNKGFNFYPTHDDWPNCIVDGCQYKRCDGLISQKCYPHTIEEAESRKKKEEAKKEVNKITVNG